MVKICFNDKCKKEFTTNRKIKRYCSVTCRKKVEGKNVCSNWNKLPTATVGVIQELRVSIDLLSKGWEVFRAVSPSASCDILAFKMGHTIKIDVKTGYRGVNSCLIYPKKNISAEYAAVALPTEIIYVPEIPEIETDSRL